MGETYKCKCNNCGERFSASMGGGMFFEQYRCVDCDSIKNVDRPHTFLDDEENWKIERSITKEEIGKCYSCGGELRNDLKKPMCPLCKSRDINLGFAIILYD